MPISTLRDLKEEFETRKNIALHCLTLYSDFDELAFPGTPGRTRIKSRFPILTRSAEAIYRVLIIEICKLLSKSGSESFTIFKLINILRHNHKNSNWRTKIAIKEILALEERLLTTRISETTLRITGYRDKYVAHLDRARSKVDTTFFHRDLRHVIDEAVFVLNRIQELVFDDPFSIELYLEARGENIFDAISDS